VESNVFGFSAVLCSGPSNIPPSTTNDGGIFIGLRQQARFIRDAIITVLLQLSASFATPI
jgi:hypothetical protein